MLGPYNIRELEVKSKYAPRHLVFVVTYLLGLFLYSCATLNTPNTKPEEALRQRVAAYWEARIKGDTERAYELLDPAAREVISFTTYARRASQFIILNYRIEKISIEPNKKEAVVRVWRSFKIKPGAIPVRIDKVLEQSTLSQWILVKGKWYMRYNLLPPPVIKQHPKS